MSKYSGISHESAVLERLALSELNRAALLCGVALAFLLYHAVKVPWAAALPADPRR